MPKNHFTIQKSMEATPDLYIYYVHKCKNGPLKSHITVTVIVPASANDLAKDVPSTKRSFSYLDLFVLQATIS